jgi:carboxyl-terminal processing protease
MIVLVNGGSASASEIVAGALKDYGKARIVGETTYGKGSVQDYLEYGDGSALKVTVALWLTPKGSSINKQGITPDFKVELTPEDFNADKDPQMDKAVGLLLSPPQPPATTGSKEGGSL